ncbi:hypothetical protein TWF506_010057 [Arthrobotrys conoides]|uniref:F-box domain-containing protein n=1 Tax=Arthrobotrys conoides TaxID=74498 RepID=A0AAN8NCL6_9PEZI
MSTQLNFTSIPSELFIAIISYLSVRDIGNLSLISKAFRRITISHLFRAARLTPESIAAFQRGGSLNHIKGLVEQLTLDTAHSGVRGPDAICTFTRACIENNDLDATFPNITGLKIVFSPETCTASGSFSMDQQILRSTLLGFSKFSFYKNKLKSLVFKVDMPGEGGINPTVQFDIDTYYQLSSENWEFVGPLVGEDEDYSYSAPDPWAGVDGDRIFPASLRELRLITPPGVRYNIFIPDHIGPGILRAASHIAKSLEKLEVLAVPPIFERDPYPETRTLIFPEDIVYENVKEFTLGLDTQGYHERLQEAVKKVPRVETFELICSTAIGFHIPAMREQPSIRFKELSVLSNLKRVFIEAPMRDEIEYYPQTGTRRGPKHESRTAGRLSIAAVIEAVTFWLKSGMDRLENVEFRLYFIPKNRLRYVFEMLELWCIVIRDGKGGWRLEWRSLKRNFENGKVEEGRFGGGMGFDREEYLDAV